MHLIKYICIFALEVNVLMLCCAAEQSNSVIKSQGPSLRVPVPSQNNDNVPIEKQKPLVVEASLSVNNSGLNKTNEKEVKNVIDEHSRIEVSKNNLTDTNNEGEIVEHMRGKLPGDIDLGAVKRGSLVFLGLCVIILGCYAWRSYRLKNASSSPVMVQKYGVRANRSDIEMRPLPLDDEEDDDTVFEIGNNTNRQ